MRRACDAERQDGFSRVELAVALTVVGVLAAALLERLHYVQEYAEKTAMDLVIAELRSQLRIKVAERLVDGRLAEIPALADEDPFTWLDRPPGNYLGELDREPAQEPRGQWYFNRVSRELVYTANNRRFFSPSVYRDFTVRLRLMRIIPDSRAETAVGGRQPEWVALVVVNDYRWF